MNPLRWKRMNELQPGDRIHMLNPSGNARVLKSYPMTFARMDMHGRRVGKVDGWAIDFEMTSGSARGERNWVDADPAARVKLA